MGGVQAELPGFGGLPGPGRRTALGKGVMTVIAVLSGVTRPSVSAGPSEGRASMSGQVNGAGRSARDPAVRSTRRSSLSGDPMRSRP
jgi:hypothetical protein